MTYSQEFVIEEVRTLEKLMEVWPFFLEGLEELNLSLKDSQVPAEEFFMTHLDIVNGEQEGVILKVNSKTMKPLAFITAFENTGKYKKVRSLLVYSIFSNRKSSEASRVAAREMEKWAKAHDFKVLHAFMGRTSGSAMHWAKRFHGFELSKLYFTKRL